MTTDKTRYETPEYFHKSFMAHRAAYSLQGEACFYKTIEILRELGAEVIPFNSFIEFDSYERNKVAEGLEKEGR